MYKDIDKSKKLCVSIYERCYMPGVSDFINERPESVSYKRLGSRLYLLDYFKY